MQSLDLIKNMQSPLHHLVRKLIISERADQIVDALLIQID